MKRNLYLYLFIFASLIALVLYVNGRNIQKSQDDAYLSLKEKLKKAESQLEQGPMVDMSADIFSLKYNDEAYDYFKSSELEIEQIELLVQDYILEQNIIDGGNPLVPYIGSGRGFRIQDTKTLNHKWIIANFTDNETWGEVLLQYNFDENKQLSMQTIKALLYSKYR